MRKLLIILLLAAIPTVAQQPTKPEKPYTVSVDVDLVIFNVTVLDKKGRLVGGLPQKNFQILEDGVPQEIRLFNPEDIPATVGLLIDNSGSMGPKIPEVIEAAGEFLHESNPQDEVFIVNFSDHVSMGLPYGVPFTSSLSELETALHTIHASGRTALYDAVAFGLKHLQEGTLQKKALVLLSDGGDNASHVGLRDVIAMSERSSATIYTIGIYDVNDPDRNPKVLKQLAKLSGGETYIPHGTYELRDIWRHIAGGIRSQYTIGYVSTNAARDGKFRNVKVSAVDNRRKALQVRTRPGYLAPS